MLQQQVQQSTLYEVTYLTVVLRQQVQQATLYQVTYLTVVLQQQVQQSTLYQVTYLTFVLQQRLQQSTSKVQIFCPLLCFFVSWVWNWILWMVKEQLKQNVTHKKPFYY